MDKPSTPWEERADLMRSILIWLGVTGFLATILFFMIGALRELDDLRYVSRKQEEVIASLRSELGIVRDLKIDIRKNKVAHMVSDGYGMEVYVVWKGEK